MSSPYVIVSAVHELECSAEEWWRDNEDSLDSFEKTYDHNNEVEWLYCEGTFKSFEALEEYPVVCQYHSNRDNDVIEILFSQRKDIQELKMTGLEKVIEEVNNRFEDDFTLEVYYYSSGTDKPGGTI